MTRNSPVETDFRRFGRLVVCTVLCLYLAGCAVAAVGTVLVTSVDIARDRRTVGTYVDDNAVELKIRHALARDPHIGRDTQIGVTSMNGIVLLTGEVARREEARRAAGIARGYTEARQVINQLHLGETADFSSRSRDTWITTRTKSSLMRSRDVSSGRVKVVTRGSIVYLMGIVTRSEADAAVEAARRVRGVERIVKVFEYLPSS
jgi:osmotically-inducible protein OsmY